MAFPKVTISEFIDGPRPVPLRSLNRVACIGTSKKGKYGQFILISTDTDLDNKIGRTLDTGSVGLQAARDEGASDTAFVRVMGAARSANAWFKIDAPGGGTTEADTLTVTIVGPGGSNAYPVAITLGSSSLQASSAVVAALAADPHVTAAYDSGTGRILLVAKAAGLAGNAITYDVVESDTSPAELTVTDTAGPGASGNLTGGLDGPAAGTLTAGDLELVAAYEGVFGNTIDVSFVPGLTETEVILNLTDGDGKTETHTLNFVASSLINGNEFATLRNSNMVRGFFANAGDINAPELPVTADNGTLAGGADGSPVTEQDYLDALSILSRNQAHVIFAPGQTSAAVRAQLIVQAQKSTILGGLRIAVLNAPKAVDIVAAETGTYTTGYDISGADYGGSAVMVAGWATYSGQPRLPELSVSPDGFYAGHLAATPIYVSPAARSSSPYFRSIVAVDTQETDVAFDAYTTGRLEAIVRDPATGGYHCLNGRSISSDTAHYYISIRRMANQIKTDLWFATQPLKSEPKTDGLVSAISNMVNSYLTGKTNVGQIKSGTITGVNKTENGIRLDFQWYPIYPADQIDYGMHRTAVDV